MLVVGLKTAIVMLVKKTFPSVDFPLARKIWHLRRSLNKPLAFVCCYHFVSLLTS